MLGRSAGIRPKVIDLNLIPLELRQPLVTTGILFLAAAILVGGGLFLLIDSIRIGTWAQIVDAEQEVTATRNLILSENHRIAKEKTEVTAIEQELKRLKEDMARDNTKTTARFRRFVSLAPAIEAALGNHPAGLSLTGLLWQEPRLGLQGRATSIRLVLAFADRLRDSKRFSQVELRSVAGATATPQPSVPASSSTGEITFALELEVAAEAG